MRAPLRYPKLTRAHVERFRELERAYHVRAFGEELARVNLDLTKDERLRYLQWMRDNARKRGIKFERPLPYGRDDEGRGNG